MTNSTAPTRLACKVFSATMKRERDLLGDVITKWLKERASVTVDEKQVLQSSDEAFHCVTIVLWYRVAA